MYLVDAVLKWVTHSMNITGQRLKEVCSLVLMYMVSVVVIVALSILSCCFECSPLTCVAESQT